MSTPISKIIERFFHIIEEDEEFFDYYNLTDEESLQLATERANAIVEEALTMWKWRCNVPVSLTIIDEFIVENDERYRAVEGDLTSDEINIVARLMFEILSDTLLTPSLISFARFILSTESDFCSSVCPTALSVIETINDDLFLVSSILSVRFFCICESA